MKEIVDRIPIFDGSMRRRLFAGLVVMVTVAISYGVFPVFLKLAIKIDGLIGSWALALCLILAMFAIGAIVELLSELIVKRALGAILWSLRAPLHISVIQNSTLRILIIIFLYLYSMSYYLIFATFSLVRFPFFITSASKYKISNSNNLYFLDENLQNPYGLYFDVSWRSLIVDLPIDRKREIIRRFSLLDDLVMMAAAALVSVTIFLTSPVVPSVLGDIPLTVTESSRSGSSDSPLPPNNITPPDESRGAKVVQFELFTYLIIIPIIPFIMIGCALIYQKSIEDAVENTRYILFTEYVRLRSSSPGPSGVAASEKAVKPGPGT